MAYRLVLLRSSVYTRGVGVKEAGLVWRVELAWLAGRCQKRSRLVTSPVELAAPGWPKAVGSATLKAVTAQPRPRLGA